MTKNFPLAAACSVLAASLFAATPSIAASLKIMAVGDSITEGYTPNNATSTASYRKVFESRLAQANCDFEMVGSQTSTYTDDGSASAFGGKHEGWSGHRADHIRDGQDSNSNGTLDPWENQGIDSMMATHNPDVVLLHIGSNDMYGGQPIGTTIAEIESIISKIINANNNAKIFVANVIPWYAQTSPWNANMPGSIRELGTQIGTKINSLGNPNVKIAYVRAGYTQSMMQSDLVHPNALGEAHIANAFYNAFTSAKACANHTPATDNTAATVTFDNPSTDNKLLPLSTVLSGTATDSGGSGLDYVRLLLLDKNSGEFVAPDGSRSNSWSWNMEHRVSYNNAPTSATWTLDTSALGLTSGSNLSIHAVAVDKANNANLAWPWTFTNFTVANDNIAPSVSFITPYNYQTLAPTSVLSGNATDTGGSGLDYVRILLLNTYTGEFVAPNGARSASWSWAMEHRVTFNNAPNSAKWYLDTSTLGLAPNSRYSLHVLPVDKANNFNPAWPWTVTNFITSDSTADTTVPTVSFNISDYQQLPRSVVLSGNASDTGGSGLDYIRILILDTNTGEFVSPNGSRSSSWSWSMEHRITYNNAPNQASWSLNTAPLGLTASNFSIHALPVDKANNSNPAWPWTYTHFSIP